MELREVREKILNSIEEELIGPGSEQIGIDKNEEIITDLPNIRYVTGILFPKENKDEHSISNVEESDLEDDNCNETKENWSLEAEPKYIERNNNDKIDEEYYEDMNNAHIILKSSMGLTFFCNKNISELKVHVKGARYKSTLIKECMVKYDGELYPLDIKPIEDYIYHENGMLKLKRKITGSLINDWSNLGYLDNRGELHNCIFKLNNQCKKSFKRKEINLDNPIVISFRNSNQGNCKIEEENLKLFALKRTYNEGYSITVMLINEADGNDTSKLIFQPEIKIFSNDNNFIFLPSKAISTSINPQLDLLYRNKKSYGIGHGVSVDFSGIDNSNGYGYIKTSYMPYYEVPNTNFEVNIKADYDILSMHNLSELSSINKERLLDGLTKFVDNYSEWIKNIDNQGNKLDSVLKETVKYNIKNCNIAKNRMFEGIELLKNNKLAFDSFKLTNTAMLIQRIQSNDEVKVDSREGLDTYRNFSKNEARWRGFQLAFLLMTISCIVDKNSEFRDVVDLIWIPTGGGKTEAYLGVSAFTIFFRRLSRGKKGNGTTIIMRYTLRLLAAQQFERASKLICACEYIRQESEYDLGNEPITIGLWIGQEQTPNDLAKTQEYLNEMMKDRYAENKFQLLKCPWCGAPLVKHDDKHNIDEIGYEIKRGRGKNFNFRCLNELCYYNDELPIQVVDECLYKKPPTLLFSTVDKFAMLTWKGEASSFFARDTENDTPELIIQDELHLISGPLGTLVAQYETVIDYLCSIKGVKPKIISSTATICEANEQVKDLYNRNTMQFPPPGIQIEDSFFTKEEDIKNKPGRLYVGVTGIGQTQITTEIRLFAAILQRIHIMDISDEEKDKYWTLVSYFNSIRELGKALTLVDDDVKDYMRRMSNRLNVYNCRIVNSARELTSRVSSSQIVKTLDNLEKKYPKDGVINILLATNMISVGVDVDRLNIMTVIGQPKLTSEYIQASSRVGRKDPGIVFTLYDGRKSRDESHYEIFQAYHQAFYKYVEPTSITPFSEPALERMIHSVLISMVRHSTPLNSEESARYFDHTDKSIKEIIDYILNRININSYNDRKIVSDILDKIIKEWEDKAEYEDIPLQYTKGRNPLINAFYKKVDGYQGIETMQSMRNVDGEVKIKVYAKNRSDE